MHNELVFTPKWCVRLMLDKVGYFGDGILHKHVIDNSCGDGSFLEEIVNRYCEAFLKGENKDNEELKRELETYIHGIEVLSDCVFMTKLNLDNIVLKYGIHDVKWDIVCGDALNIKEYDGCMDYVVGNPPYCNVHDFGENYKHYKSFKFVKRGMSDLYLIFFELGMNMLNKTGKLIYITPSSWCTSIAGYDFRKYLIESNRLESVIKMGHRRVFNNATTFSIITQINNEVEEHPFDEEVTLYKYEEDGTLNYYATRKLSFFTVNDKFFFNEDSDSIRLIRDITEGKYNRSVKVKNGFATLNDKLFVLDELNPLWQSNNVIYAVKASTCELKRMIFPYSDDGKPLEFEELDEYARDYLLRRRVEIYMPQNSKERDEWWLYGRTQAIVDTFKKNRYSVNNLIRSKSDIKIACLREMNGVYGGYYILDEDNVLDESKINEYLVSEEFVNYVKALSRYKNGGYYTFTTKELENYLNYKLNER